MKLRWICLKLLQKIYIFSEYGSEMPSKLSNLISLYSRLMDIEKMLEELNLGISDCKEMKQV